MKTKAAIASIMAAVAVGALAACTPRRADAPAPAEAPADVWVRKKVVLYLPDRVMKERVAIADLSPYLAAVDEAVAAAAEAQPIQPGASGMMLLMVKPGGRAKAWVVTGEPAPRADTVAAVVKAVEAVPAPAVREGPILVGVGFEAWGGGAPPAGASPPIPRDWYGYFSKDGGRLDDAFMARVWPD